MKSLCLYLALVVGLLAAVDMRKPIPEVRLNDGRVLKNVEIVSFATNAVMAKWDGGRGTIRHEQMPADLLAAMPEAAKSAPEPTPQAPLLIQGPTRKITGQFFERDYDRGGAFKFIDAEIKAYPLDGFAAVKKTQIEAYRRMPKSADEDMRMRDAFTFALKSVAPVAVCRTDADGKFEIEVPENRQVFLHARGILKYQGASLLRMWAVEVNGNAINLTGDNRWQQWRQDPSLKP